MQDIAPTYAVGQADIGKMVVLEDAEYWTCVWVEQGGLDWIMVTMSRLVRQRYRGPACYGVLRDHLRFLGPLHRACRCTPENIPQTLAVFVDVMKEPRVPGQEVWPVALSNMWQSGQAAAMCKLLRGHATALPRAPAAQSSSNRPAASLAMLHGGPRAWCWVIVALEPHSSALRMYDRGESTEHGPPCGPGGPAPRCLERRPWHSAIPPGDRLGISGAPVPQALRMKCLLPGHG